MEYILLASSNTVPGIEKCINDFFYSKSSYYIEGTAISNEFLIRHYEKGILPKARVVKKGKRYRFEMESSK